MTDVKSIFNNTYKIYSLFHNYALFNAIISNMHSETHEVVKGVLTETYNMYVKYQNCSNDSEIKELCDEVHRLCDKYQCKLCQEVCIALLDIIETTYKSKK